LRTDFAGKHHEYDTGGLYQGYMDMSYFAFSTKLLKDKGLKIAIVYLHEKGAFEVWLSARNWEIARRYESTFAGGIACDLAVFHDDQNPDAIIESALTNAPDFEDPAALMERIEQGAETFKNAITRYSHDAYARPHHTSGWHSGHQ
jgi:hypothetical protein